MKKHLKSSVALLLLFIAVTARFSFAGDVAVPDGWRMPAGAEVEDEWRDYNASRYLEVKADFDGDGAIDAARIFVRPDGSELSLFAYMCDRDGNCKEHLLASVKGAKAIRHMGIDRVYRGLYKTACGKVYRECREGETPEIEIKKDSIDFFENTGGNSYFYWDEGKKAFNRVWMSD